jgi:hypothetical protein
VKPVQLALLEKLVLLVKLVLLELEKLDLLELVKPVQPDLSVKLALRVTLEAQPEQQG